MSFTPLPMTRCSCSIFFFMFYSLFSQCYSQITFTGVTARIWGKRALETILEYLNDGISNESREFISLDHLLKILRPAPYQEDIDIKEGRLCHMCHHLHVGEPLPCCEECSCCDCIRCIEGSELL